MSHGFKGFAKPTKLDIQASTAAIANLADDEFVYNSGGQYRRRRNSGRSRSLATVSEVRTPVPVREYAKRALDAGPNKGEGYDTSISIGGLTLHQIAKPTVYFYLVKDHEGNYRAKTDIPNPDPTVSPKPIAAGEIVIPAGKKVPAKKAPAKRASKKAPAKRASK